MTRRELTAWQRLALAFWAFFMILLRREVATAVDAARARARLPAEAAPSTAAVPPAPPTTPERPPPEGGSRRAALQLLSALQREGRLVDFVEEDLAGYPDATVGAAARAVHAGCKRALEEWFRLEPVLREPEGATVEVGSGFDPAALRLTGNVVGKPPFRGALRHHGWRARDVKVPQASDGMDPAIVAPAEVELP